jgi:hypothetical protein
METPDSPEQCATTEDASAPSVFSSLEIAGAICAHVIHDLSNQVSGLIGNAEYAQDPESSPEGVRKAVQAIGVSANAAGKLLRQCLPLQSMISGEASFCPVNELALLNAESSVQAPGWIATEPPPLKGRVRVQSRWLVASIWQIVRDAGAGSGEVEFANGPAVFPVVWHGTAPGVGRAPELFQITLRYRSEQLLFTPKGPANPEQLGLLAAHEMVRRFKGQIQSRPKPPGRQEISILLPLA